MNDLRQPWLVAAWPGMGHVGVLAASFLLEGLGAEQVEEFELRDYFDLKEVSVSGGVMEPPRHPRGIFYTWRNPSGPRDLVIFLSEAQPPSRGYALCEELIAKALQFGITRVTTFAAMATPADPQAVSRVFAAATDAETFEEIRQFEVLPLKEGAIGGLNGVLLAAALAREVPGLCLLGEFPYFASTFPQPKAAAAILRVFCRAAGIDLDLSGLDEQAKTVEVRLTELLKQLRKVAMAQLSENAPEEPREGPDMPREEAEELEEGAEEPEEMTMDPAIVAHIEALFVAAEQDRTKAFELKSLLDQHGVFKVYEDRFLDLFKHGE